MPQLDLDLLIDGRPIPHHQVQEDWTDGGVPMIMEDVQVDVPTDFDRLPYVFKGIDWEVIDTQGKLMDQLSLHIPLNEINLPHFIYRPDMIHFDTVREDVARIFDVPLGEAVRIRSFLEATLRSAIVTLDYREGFPVYDKSQPIWEQFPFEPRDDYVMFLEYLNAGASRALHKVISWKPEIITEAAKTYYWQLRAESFDIYRVAYHEKLRLTRILNVEDSHFQKSESMLDRLYKAFESYTADDLKDIGPDKLVSAIEKVTKIQRSSVGLKDAESTADVLRTPSMAAIMRRMATETIAPQSKTQEVDLYSDPDILEKAQDLIMHAQNRD